ncbi:hypothetical protein K1719_031760 [Acacia pycnantha]|nr:hypothetical protein K1719_031760 [Acacia pycnantha]
MIFNDVVASGEDQYSLSAGQPQAQEEDCYRPTMDDAEGSGDSEDERVGVDPVPSIGVSAHLGSMNLSGHRPPIVPTASGCHSKRKRGEEPIYKKRQKILASKQIADAISVVIATASQDRAERCNDIHAYNVKNVMSELLALEEVLCDENFRNQCAAFLLDEVNREMFVSFLENNEYLISWLRFMSRLMAAKESDSGESNEQQNCDSNCESFGQKCSHMVKKQRTKFYILRRCIAMLLCWHERGEH